MLHSVIFYYVGSHNITIPHNIIYIKNMINNKIPEKSIFLSLILSLEGDLPPLFSRLSIIAAADGDDGDDK